MKPPCVDVIVPNVSQHWYGFLDEGVEVDPHLVGNWLAFSIQNVALVKTAMCNEVKGIKEELLGGVHIICEDPNLLTDSASFE